MWTMIRERTGGAHFFSYGGQKRVQPTGVNFQNFGLEWEACLPP